jgi:hypothetical protein
LPHKLTLEILFLFNCCFRPFWKRVKMPDHITTLFKKDVLMASHCRPLERGKLTGYAPPPLQIILKSGLTLISCLHIHWIKVINLVN